MAPLSQFLVFEDGRIPQRYIIAIMCFLGLANTYIMRFCLSIAMTTMVSFVPTNISEIEGNATYKENYCPYDNDTVSDVFAQVSEGEFDWSESAQGAILSAFFWGYILTQVPGGILAEKIGGKYTLMVGILISTIGTLLTPLAAREGDVLGLIEIRIIIGLGQGFVYPSLNVLLAHWAPLTERGRLGSIVFAGANFGTVVSMTASGFILSWSENAWHNLFYIYGAISTVWLIVWMYVGYSSPEDHPSLSDKEKAYLKKYYEEAKLQEIKTIPWHSILTSVPIWGLIVSQIGHDWGLFTITFDLPKYMQNVMHFTIAQNGLLSGLPYLIMCMVAFISGWIVDWMLVETKFTVTTTRKIFTTIAAVGPALGIIGATYSGCNRFAVTSLIAIGVGSMGCFYPSLKVNPLDLSPNFAGTLMALVGGIGAIAGVFTPWVTGLLIADNTLSQWRAVFLLSAVILLVTNLFYLYTGTAEMQPWNDPKYSLQLEEIRYNEYMKNQNSQNQNGSPQNKELNDVS